VDGGGDDFPNREFYQEKRLANREEAKKFYRAFDFGKAHSKFSVAANEKAIAQLCTQDNASLQAEGINIAVV
jgi:hypothetical protein